MDEHAIKGSGRGGRSDTLASRLILNDKRLMERQLADAQRTGDVRRERELRVRLAEIWEPLRQIGKRLLADGSESRLREASANSLDALIDANGIETRLTVGAALAKPQRSILDDDPDDDDYELLSKGVCSGYGAVYYVASLPGSQYDMEGDGKTLERLKPGCFTATLASGREVKSFINHQRNFILGRTSAGNLTLTTDSRGLRYAVRPSATSYAKDLIANLRAKVIAGSSFSFQVMDVRWYEEGEAAIREVLAVDLYEVGPVAEPAYDATSAGYTDTGRGQNSLAAAFGSVQRMRMLSQLRERI